MSPRKISLAVLSLLVAGVCVWLGFWQLRRLEQRRAFNAALAQRFAAPPVSFPKLPRDTSQAHYRRVVLSGKYDYANEIVLTSRTRNGSPGVNIVTPLRHGGTDTAVLVNRGWVYAPDGMTVDLSRWRESDSVTGDAYVETYPPPRKGNTSSPSHPNAFRWLDRSLLEKRLSYPLASYYVVQTSRPAGAGSGESDTGGRGASDSGGSLLRGGDAQESGTSTREVPPRIGAPKLDDGPHRNYAIQWFSFAAISIIGMFLFVRRK